MFSLPMSPETEILKMNRPGAIAPGPQRRLQRLAAAAAPPLPGRGKAAQHGEKDGKDYGTVLTRRKPRLKSRDDGQYLRRSAERQSFAKV